MSERHDETSSDWLGTKSKLYHPKLWHKAAQIEVARFRQIYTWPLVLQQRDRASNKESIIDAEFNVTIQALSAPSSSWKEIVDLLNHLPGNDAADSGHSYAEFVYFHDYVQSVLFRPQQTKAPLRLFERKDVAHADVVLDQSRRFRLSVGRCNLYVFQNGTAILAIELDSGGTPMCHGPDSDSRRINLADVQDFADRARRCYTPYFSGETAQAVPTQFTWLDAVKQPIGQASTPKALCDEFARIKNATSARMRTAPVFSHWLELLAPLKLAGYEGNDWSGPVWRQIVDERIPAISFISLTGAARQHGAYDQPKSNSAQPVDAFQAMQDVRIVSRGDWMRLCFADSAGNDALPYAPDFVAKFEEDACYDRHFPSEATTSATRFMFAGYHVATVGAGRYFDDVIAHHFRRHYFQMSLILQMELASLLAISSRISEAVRNLHETSSGEKQRNPAVAAAYTVFRDNMIRIEENFLEVLHLFRFTGLSNQIQPREMFAKWRHALELDSLFSDLKDELAAATQFLLSKEQAQRAETANNLSTIAAIGVVLGLAFSFLGMNVLMGEKTIDDLFLVDDNTNRWVRLLFEVVPLGVVVAATSAIGLLISRRLLPAVHDPARRGARTVLWWTLIAGLLIAILGFAGAKIVGLHVK